MSTRAKATDLSGRALRRLGALCRRARRAGHPVGEGDDLYYLTTDPVGIELMGALLGVAPQLLRLARAGLKVQAAGGGR